MLTSGIAHAGNRIFLESMIVKDGDITLMPAYGGMPENSIAFTTPIMLISALRRRADAAVGLYGDLRLRGFVPVRRGDRIQPDVLHDIEGVRMPDFFAHLTPAVESRTLVTLSHNGFYGLTEGYLSYEMNYQADLYQVSVDHQQPYGADSSFVGQRYVLYTTFFYGWLLKKMGDHSTPF
jgi:hypothetical protein